MQIGNLWISINIEYICGIRIHVEKWIICLAFGIHSNNWSPNKDAQYCEWLFGTYFTLHFRASVQFEVNWIEWMNKYPVDTIRFAFATLSVWSRLLHWTTFYATPSRSTPHRRRTEATAAEHKRTRNESEFGRARLCEDSLSRGLCLG